MKTLADIPLHPKDRQAIAAAVSLLKEQFPVQSVTLFGSKATGQDDAESDIDLLVLTTRTLSWSARDAVSDALFDVELAHDVVISTLVLPTEEWEGGPYQASHPRRDRTPGRTGMTRQDARRAVVAYWTEKATEAVASAEAELEAGRLSFAVNRGYYACFYARSGG